MTDYFGSKNQFIVFRDLLHTTTGIRYTVRQRAVLARRVQLFCGGIPVAELSRQLAAEHRSALIDAVIDAVSSHETRFFRHSDQLEFFASYVRESAARPVRIWSAGCSTGEEPYTLAMLASDALQTTSRACVEILATDLSDRVLRRGQDARYPIDALADLPAGVTSRHFIADPDRSDRLRVAPYIRRLVKFRRHNLQSGRRILEDADVVVCRNVLHYFDLAARKRALALLFASLRHGGLLILGPCDAIRDHGSVFRNTAQARHLLLRMNQEHLLFPVCGMETDAPPDTAPR